MWLSCAIDTAFNISVCVCVFILEAASGKPSYVIYMLRSSKQASEHGHAFRLQFLSLQLGLKRPDSKPFLGTLPSKGSGSPQNQPAVSVHESFTYWLVANALTSHRTAAVRTVKELHILS